MDIVSKIMTFHVLIFFSILLSLIAVSLVQVHYSHSDMFYSMSLINHCNHVQTIKIIIILYLGWLPSRADLPVNMYMY